MSVNKAMLLGRLGKDPELRSTAGGKAVCTFSIATESTFKTRDGEKKKQTEWHNIVVWSAQAEACVKYLARGSLAYVEGELRTRNYEKDGVKRYATEVIARDVKFLSYKKDGAEGGGHDPGDWHGSDEDLVHDDYGKPTL